MTFIRRTSAKRILAVSISGAIVFAPLTMSPAYADECVPTSTTTWTGDGSDGSTVGTVYTVAQFSTAITCSWTIPAGVTSVAALAVGGGGGGAGASGSHLASPKVANSGAAGAGGGGAEVSTASGSVTPGQSLTIVVGAGGARGDGGGGAGIAGSCGATGGTSSIAELSLSADGGLGGIGGGQNSTCTAPDNKDGSGYFLPGDGGNSATGMTGGSPSGTQAGSGASATSNGASSTAVVVGQAVSFAGISATFGNGGGGGGRGATWGSTGAGAGSGGGGGRESLYDGSLYWYGYAGTAGVAGTIALRYLLPSYAGTASSPSAIVLGEDVPEIAYETEPATTPSDWTTEPTCEVYAADNLSTPLTTIVEPGQYVTQCSGGVLANGADVAFSPGTLTVDPLEITASTPDAMKVGDPLPEVTFTTSPSGYTPTWTTEPTCAIYAEDDLKTPLTSITSPGTYVSLCSGGELSNGATDFDFQERTFVVAAADSGGGGSGGGSLVLTGWAFATTLSLIFMAGLLFVGSLAVRGAKNRLIVAGEDARLKNVLQLLNAKLARMEKRPRRR
jgi:hypothetical protein